MKLKFWKKEDSNKDDTTTITVATDVHGAIQISVTAKTSRKAMRIYKHLRDNK